MLPRAFSRRTFVTAVSSKVPSIEKSHITAAFRTGRDDPAEHTANDLARFYTVPSDDKNKIFLHGGLPKSFAQQTKTFNETCLMVREPASYIIKSLQQLDYTRPAVRFVLYGKAGSGKSLSLAHILHYAHRAGFLLVHVPWVGEWTRRPKEYSNSEKSEGRIDLNIDAAAWLVHFKTQNAHILSNPNVKMSQDHVWSKRETTNKDASLVELIDHGINRLKYASEAIVVLAQEIKNLTEKSIVRTLVSIDGFNGFFYPKTRVKAEKKTMVPPSDLTVTEAFLNLTRFDWKNAAIVVTVDELVLQEEDQINYLPRFLLGKEGFEHLDPFVPVCVPEYSDKELTSCLDYYRDRKWILSVDGQDELKFLSASNPYKLMLLCNGL